MDGNVGNVFTLTTYKPLNEYTADIKTFGKIDREVKDLYNLRVMYII